MIMTLLYPWARCVRCFAFRTKLSRLPNRRRSYNNSGCWLSPRTGCAGWAGDSDDGAGAFVVDDGHGADAQTMRFAAGVCEAAAADFGGLRRPHYHRYHHCSA